VLRRKDLEIEKLTTNLRMRRKVCSRKFQCRRPSGWHHEVGGGTINSKNALDFKMAATLTDVIGAAGSPVAVLARF